MVGAVDSPTRFAAIQEIPPLTVGIFRVGREHTPAGVLFIAAVGDGVIAPVGLAGIAAQVGCYLSIGIIIVGITTASSAPWLIAGCAMVVATGAPAEQVAVNIAGCSAILGIADIFPLVNGKLPVWRGGAADVLQVTW